ncbi:MAG: hypothetical protein A2V98_02120 [Planctomycetes bacterium RBG_16_64_12]|nr:MAG: hypothetical protein A2V98_02120 [Planctomycetes bacterium RBG_16_64_12]
MFQGLANRHAHKGRVARLDEELVDSPLVDRPDSRLDRGVACQHEAHHLGVVVGHPGEQVDARHTGHLFVGHNDIDFAGLQYQECFIARGGRIELVGLHVQGTSQSAKHVWVVVD